MKAATATIIEAQPVTALGTALGAAGGLEPLKALGAFQVQQQVELLEAALNAISIDYEGANKYKVKDIAGNDMYFVAEESGCLMRQCCSPWHTMTLHMTDMRGVKVLTMHRPWALNCCCLELGNMCGKSHMEFYGGADIDEAQKIGSIGMPCCGGGFVPTFNILDRNGDTRAAVKGPCCCVSDLCGAKFSVHGADGAPVGEVKKLGVKSFKGAAKELGTDADNFELSFPVDTDVNVKALMIGALLMLDYTFFESGGATEFNPFTGTCKLKCCDMYCCGCIVPCSCNCGGNTTAAGAPVRAEGPAEGPYPPAGAEMTRD